MRSIESMDEEQRLDEALVALRREEAHVEAPAHVEASVMGAWDANQSLAGTGFRRPDVASVRTWQGIAALAAGVVLTVALTRLGEELRSGAVTPAESAAATLLLVGEPILEGEAVRLVRMRMPTSTLVNLGMRSTTGDLADAVDVDVLVGEDGVARAIKF